MNEFEEMLRNQLKDAIENEDPLMTKEVLESTKNTEYIYKIFPLWNGGMNSEGKYEYIHALLPKDKDDLKISNENLEFNGIRTEIKDRLYLATKEVIDTKLEKSLYEFNEFNKVNDLREKIIEVLNDYTGKKIIDILSRCIHPKNCIKCIHWNYGRMNWRCLKGHGTSIDKKADHYRELIPFVRTAAYTCIDYEPKRIEENYMKLEEIKKDG